MGYKDDRDIYVRTPLKLGHITQGSIFSGAISESYRSCEVYGIVITARCSVSNKKLTSYHYLPVVKYEDWINNDFRELLLEETMKKYKGKLKDILRQNKQSVEIIEQFKFEKIKEIISPTISSEKKQNEFCKAIDEIIELNDINIVTKRIIELNSKGAEDISKRLISNDLASFYLIENWEKDSSNYYIILLNEICVLRKDVFFKIGNGLLAEHIDNDSYNKSDICIRSSDDICFVNAQVDSPFIEHILQRFHYNFGRIGVENIHNNTIENLKENWI